MTQAPARLRYRRVVALGAAGAVTAISMVGGVGLLFTGGPANASTGDRAGAGDRASLTAVEHTPAVTPTPEGRSSDIDPALIAGLTAAPALPPESGEGRRIVFDQSAQRVWLVARNGTVRRTYPVSGSIYDNLQPGTYQVYSKSPRATGIDDSGTMRLMVRFAHGDNAAIGFHTIPEIDGEPVQTEDQLGTPLSHGCIRQATADARALWRFAPLGTQVTVVA